MTNQTHKTGGQPVVALLVVLAAGLCTAMTTTAITPALPGMAQYFAAQPDAEFLAKLSLTIPALVIIFSAGVVGALIDRTGPRPVMAASILLYAVAGGSGLVADSLFAVMGGRALLGLAVAGITTAGLTTIGTFYQGAEQHRIVGYHSAATSFGGMLCLVAGAGLAGLGWRWAFLLHLLALLALPLVLALPRRPRHETAPKAVGDAPRSVDWPMLLTGYGLVLVATSLFYVIPVQVPFEFAARGLPTYASGLALALCTCAAGASGLLQSRLHGAMGTASISSLALFLVGLGQLAGASSNLVFCFAGMAIAGAGIGLTLATVNTIVLRAAPPALRGRIVGAATSFLFLAQFVAPFLAQLLIQQHWQVLPATGTLAIGLACGVLVLCLANLVRRQAE